MLRNLLNFGAGSALGIFVGLAVGISVTSGVTGMIIGSVAAGLTLFLGFGKKRSTSEDGDANRELLRLVGFGIFSSVALGSGIWIRTHELLSPSPMWPFALFSAPTRPGPGRLS